MARQASAGQQTAAPLPSWLHGRSGQTTLHLPGIETHDKDEVATVAAVLRLVVEELKGDLYIELGELMGRTCRWAVEGAL